MCSGSGPMTSAPSDPSASLEGVSRLILGSSLPARARGSAKGRWRIRLVELQQGVPRRRGCPGSSGPECSRRPGLQVDHDGAFAAAGAVDQRRRRDEDLGPLADVPLALKDVITTAASRPRAAPRFSTVGARRMTPTSPASCVTPVWSSWTRPSSTSSRWVSPARPASTRAGRVPEQFGTPRMRTQLGLRLRAGRRAGVPDHTNDCVPDWRTCGRPLQMYMADLCTVPSNFAGNAAASFPCGLAAEDGLPVCVARDGTGAGRRPAPPGRRRRRTGIPEPLGVPVLSRVSDLEVVE